MGITEKDIDAERKNDSQTQQMKPHFKNKPPLKPFQTDCPIAINQVDIVDLSCFPSTYTRKKVLLTNMFSLWLTYLASFFGYLLFHQKTQQRLDWIGIGYRTSLPARLIDCLSHPGETWVVDLIVNKVHSFKSPILYIFSKAHLKCFSVTRGVSLKEPSRYSWINLDPESSTAEHIIPNHREKSVSYQ